MGISNQKNIASKILCCNGRNSQVYNKDIEVDKIIDNSTKFKYITLIQSFFRGYSIRKKYNCHPVNMSSLCQEMPSSFSTEKYENNEKIIKLRNLLSKFELNEKEKFQILSTNYKNIVLKYFDGSIYKGYVNKNLLRECYGIYYFPNNSIYEGFFKNNKMEGRGRLFCIDGFVYDGEFVNNLFTGFGTLISLDGVIYKGNWLNDKQQGYGEETYIDGSYYKGFFINGKKNGKGKFTWKNGNYYEGDFLNDEITGIGTYHWKDGKIYSRNWKNHKMEGAGVFIWPDRKMYIGYYLNDTKNGFGIFYSTNNKKFEGFWKNGKQHGKGIVINNLQQKIFLEYNEGEKLNKINDIAEQEEIEKNILMEKNKINLTYYLELSNNIIKEIKNVENVSVNKDKDIISNGVNYGFNY